MNWGENIIVERFINWGDEDNEREVRKRSGENKNEGERKKERKSIGPPQYYN